MSTISLASLETISPTGADQKLAFESSRSLATHKLERQKSVRLKLLGEGHAADVITIPGSALRLLQQILNEMSQGNAVTLIPNHAELTTQQAADLLNVSRPYMVKLLEEKKLPCRAVGKYRRIRFDDLMAFKSKDDDARSKILDQLSSEAQELGMGY